ncbi:MAG: hypothetical protein AAB638_00830 [Patescibacteria group bacterium]
MPAVNFKKQFIFSVVNGTKLGTVRQVNRKRPIREGDILKMFTGMRTKQCHKHVEYKCVKVYPIKVNYKKHQIILDGVSLVPVIQHWFATTDGFNDSKVFFQFFKEQAYQRPTVWIVWQQEIVDMIDVYLLDMKSVKTQNFASPLIQSTI